MTNCGFTGSYELELLAGCSKFLESQLVAGMYTTFCHNAMRKNDCLYTSPVSDDTKWQWLIQTWEWYLSKKANTSISQNVKLFL